MRVFVTTVVKDLVFAEILNLNSNLLFYSYIVFSAPVTFGDSHLNQIQN